MRDQHSSLEILWVSRNALPATAQPHEAVSSRKITSMNPKDFTSAYVETVYTAGGISWVFSSEDSGLELYGGRTFALITAANPRSEPWSDADNAGRNAAMQLEIAAHGWAFEGSIGSSPIGDWREHGFLIWDAPLEEVLKLGRDYGQNAVCYGSSDRVALVWCDDGDLEWFYAKPH